MSETTNMHFIAFDNDANLNLFDPETCKSEFENQQEAFWERVVGADVVEDTYKETRDFEHFEI